MDGIIIILFTTLSFSSLMYICLHNSIKSNHNFNTLRTYGNI